MISRFLRSTTSQVYQVVLQFIYEKQYKLFE